MISIRNAIVRFIVWMRSGTLESWGHYSGPGGDIRTAEYQGKDPTYASAPPIANCVLVNRDNFTELPNWQQEGIMTHELGHRQRHWFSRYLVLALMGAPLIFAMLLLWNLVSPRQTYEFVSVGSPAIDVAAAIGGLILFVAAENLEELLADLYAFKVLGEESYRETLEAIRFGGDASIGARLYSRLMYPKISTSTRIYQFLAIRGWYGS